MRIRAQTDGMSREFVCTTAYKLCTQRATRDFVLAKDENVVMSRDVRMQGPSVLSLPGPRALSFLRIVRVQKDLRCAAFRDFRHARAKRVDVISMVLCMQGSHMSQIHGVLCQQGLRMLCCAYVLHIEGSCLGNACWFHRLCSKVTTFGRTLGQGVNDPLEKSLPTLAYHLQGWRRTRVCLNLGSRSHC